MSIFSEFINLKVERRFSSVEIQKVRSYCGEFFIGLLSFLLNDGSLALANESEIDELTNLTYKVEGTYQGEPAEYWYRFKDIGTEEEYVRFDVSPLESEETRIVILDKKTKRSFTKRWAVIVGWKGRR